MPRKTRRNRPAPPLDGRASMRPRPDAAENRGICSSAGPRMSCFNEAAARCRGKPAADRAYAVQLVKASMRPRPDAAENRLRDLRPVLVTLGFNEAAARCRGKRRGARLAPCREAVMLQ